MGFSVFKFAPATGTTTTGTTATGTTTTGTTTTGTGTTSSFITFKGLSYGTDTSPYTSKIWLDRNIGATQICTSIADTSCYGSYFQWGRSADGHEVSNSTLAFGQATNITINNNGHFISVSSDWTTADASGVARVSTILNSTAGTEVCPVGFRVPTHTELSAELIGTGTANAINANQAYFSFLTIPSAGLRLTNGNLLFRSTIAYLWTSTPNTLGQSTHLYANNVHADVSHKTIRSAGMPIRCIKN